VADAERRSDRDFMAIPLVLIVQARLAGASECGLKTVATNLKISDKVGQDTKGAESP
jgi:hypothetical protein